MAFLRNQNDKLGSPVGKTIRRTSQRLPNARPVWVWQFFCRQGKERLNQRKASSRAARAFAPLLTNRQQVAARWSPRQGQMRRQ